MVPGTTPIVLLTADNETRHAGVPSQRRAIMR
jgi:hypothetical protein